MNVLDKQLCLQLNANWQVIGVRSVRDTVVSLCSEAGPGHTHPALALDMETAIDENGETVLISAVPTPWELWIDLPVREDDLYITASHGRKVRVPTVTIAVNYAKVPLRRPRFSTGNVHERDGYICGYTGEKLTRSTASVDHILPRSRGGKDDWRNVTSCSKRVNALKGALTPQEAGLTLLRKPAEPAAIPVSAAIKSANHPSWQPFLLK